MGLLTMTVTVRTAAGAPAGAPENAFATFDLTGGRIGSGAVGSGQGGLAGRRR
ncbi:hypothetical protein V1L54_17025 [Streptomyces sp. TRM 70361]|uniref:hypothetical protein n=1 Tax=Streptomyces sp. TRM 70361 TaxID=3116553 RepID=UPI002E7AC4B0|nr:hypothetical protein [Streptomyces sp. TRM 70361]MEE1941085.1 hypothetical protein [Streptomyces sp. TRM 70361]